MTKPIKVEAKQHLAEALRFLSSIPKNDNGRISWSSNELDTGAFEVIYSLTFSPSIDDHVKDAAVWHTLNECARANDFSTMGFMQRLRDYLKTHLSKTPKRFLAVAQVNATGAATLPNTIPSTSGLINIRPNLPRACLKIIDELDGYEQERLGLP